MAKITSTFKMRDNATSTMERVIGAVNKFRTKIEQANASTSKIKNNQSPVEKAFSNWEAKVVAINQGLQLTQSIARGVGKALEYSDKLTLTKARLDLMNDGLQTTEELQNKIFAAAQRSRGSYEDMASSVAKLGLLAGDAFKNNDEMIAFSEMMNKSFKVSGAGQQEISSATYQLTQAMAAGKLQGDEFRSIMENAPMLADAIAKYTGKSKGELKEMSSEGLITADIIKNALFSAADDINAKYEEMPKTFGDAMTNIKNTAAMELQPVADKITEVLNSDTFQSALDGILTGIRIFGSVAVGVVSVVAGIFGFLADNMWFTVPAITAVAIVMGATLIPKLWAATKAILLKGAAWALANWQMLAVAGVIGIVVGALVTMNPVLWGIVAVLGALLLVYAAWQVAQWAMNTALYACPIVWIIVLVIALIAAIYLFMQWIAKASGLASSGLGMIAGGVNVVIQFFKNLGLLVANIALGIWNALGACADNIGIAFKNTIANIKSWFYGLLETVMNVIGSIVKTLNKIPFIDIDVSGIEGKAKEYADKKAAAEDSKEAYKSVSDAFSEGMNTFDTFSDGWVEDAFNSGAAWGDNVANSIGDALGSFDPASMLSNIIPEQQDYGSDYDYSSMLDGNGNMPVSIEKDKTGEVDISDEDLKMLKDIATRDYMLNYKHVTPNVNIEFGDVRETADVNKIKDAISKMMAEELSELYVVEEA